MTFFNRLYLTKVLIIFIVGFITRFLVNVYLDVNVFSEFASTTSLIYYVFFSFMIVSIHGIIDYFNFNIIPNFIIDFFSITVNKITYNLNFKNVPYIFNKLFDKNTLNGINTYNKKDIIVSNKNNTTLFHKGDKRSSKIYETQSNIQLGSIAIYGHYLIIYFKLEEKYPWLAKWIKLRRKFMYYYIGLNIFLIILMLLLIIYVNWIVLKYGG